MENNVMFMGNFRNDQHKSVLAQSIHYLFNRCLNFQYIKCKDIKVKGESKKCKHAFITLRSEDDYNEAYYKLTSFESRMQLGFNFLGLFDPSKQINVNRKKAPKIMKNSPLNSKNSQPVITGKEKENIPANNKNTQRVVCADERKSSPPKIGNQPPAVSVDFQPKKQDNDSVKQKQTFYREGELLGHETRDKEFKKGGGEFVSNELKGCVSKYMSGFLNSSQQGTLFIGVKDNGSVVGIDCDQKKEDDIRICIDQVMKTITPAIFPNHYHVEFIPVYEDGKAKADCKVLEITVNILDLGTPEQLYEVSGEVYMSLDGTIERLKPSKIQEWTKQVHQKELKRQLLKLELEAKKNSEVHQKELKRQLLKLELEAKKNSEVHQEELKRQQFELELEAKKKSEVHQKELKRQQLQLEAMKKSKVCVLM